MGAIYSKPGEYIYVKYYKFPIFKRWQSTRFDFVTPEGKDLRFFGKPIQVVPIYDQPIEIILEEDNFKTVDHAVFKLSLKLQVNPILENSSGREQLLKCVPVYVIDKASKQESLNCPQVMLEKRLHPLLTMLRSYKFSDLKEYLNTSEAASSEAKLENDMDLRSLIETKACEILEKYNFQVYGLCVIDLYHPDLKDLNDDNDYHHAMIDYLQTHEVFKQALIKKKDEHNEEILKLDTLREKKSNKLKDELIEIEQNFIASCRKKELENEKDIKKIETDYESAITKMDKEQGRNLQNLNDDHDAMLKEQKSTYQTKINQIKFKFDEKQNDLKLLNENNIAEYERNFSVIRESVVEIKQKNSDNSLKESLIDLELIKNIEEIKIENDLFLIEKRNKLPGDKNISQTTYSWQQVQDIMESRYNQKQKEIENAIYELGLERDEVEQTKKFEIEKLNKELEREFIRDDLKYELLKRIFEREIIFAYSQLKTENQTEVVERLGKQLTNIVQAATGVVDEIKLYGLPGSSGEGSHSEGISTLLAGLYKVMPVFPEIGEALSELGIKWKDTSDQTEKQNATND